MNEREQDALIEAAATSFRERDAEGWILPSPAWMDLPAAAREEAFERGLSWRRLERALDPDGLSATARSVLARARRLGQL